MSSFTGKLQYVYLDNGLAKITQPVIFYLCDHKKGLHVALPVGALTNFASIPKFLRWIFPIDHEDYKIAAAFHDWLVQEFPDSDRMPWIYGDNGARLYIPNWQEDCSERIAV